LDLHNKNHFLEQDTLNIIYKGKIGLLPLKYGIYLFGNIDQYIKAYYEEKMRIFINRIRRTSYKRRIARDDK